MPKNSVSDSDKLMKAKIRILEERLRRMKSCREQDFRKTRRERGKFSKRNRREHSESENTRRERDTESSTSSTSSSGSRSPSRSLSPPVRSKFRRIISSDEESSCSSNNNGNTPTSPLQEDVLSLLGPNVAKLDNKGPEIQTDLADRWVAIIKQGLSPEERNSLISEYPIPDNCTELNPPKLNDVIMTAFTESATRRDLRLALLQTQVGAAITALGLVITDLLKQKEGGANRVTIKRLSDAGRLLTDLFHCESTSRKELASMVLNKDLKDTLDKTNITEWLFGDDLEEKIKASKNMQRSSQELKSAKTKVFKNLNSKRLPRTTLGTRQDRQPVHQSRNRRNRSWQQHQDPHRRQHSDKRAQSSTFQRRNTRF